MAKVEASGQKGEAAVREHIVKHCKTVKGVDEKKEKLCFFIGAHPDSATSVLGDIAKPLSFHKPPKKVCSELKEKDSQICTLKYDKPIDWDSLVLEKMRVKQLKELLQKLGDSCKGCTEKVDYITRINELKPKPQGEL
uniref:Mesencephalic astrocyte-derived neurotrophic factor homolog n=1 Tax=Globodera pallida TaxID=36090 RepID=A0A183BKN7_GLOPA